MEIEDQSLERAKKRFYLSLAFLAVGVLYSFWPVDFIPDFLGPIGWVDDLSALVIAAFWSARNYSKLKKIRESGVSS